MHRGWTQIDYQNKHYNIDQKEEGSQDDRGRDGGTNFILRIKEQEKRLTPHEHDDDDDELLSVACRQNYFSEKLRIFIISQLPCAPTVPNLHHRTEEREPPV